MCLVRCHARMSTPPAANAGGVIELGPINVSEVQIVDPEQPERSPGNGVSGWILAALGLLLAILVAVCGVTLYRVSQIEDQNTQAKQTQEAVKATKALLKVMAARQISDQNVHAKVQAADNETKALLTETQQVLTETKQVLGQTKSTISACWCPATRSWRGLKRSAPMQSAFPG